MIQAANTSAASGPTPAWSIPTILFSGSVALLILAVLSGDIRWWTAGGASLLPASRVSVPLVLILIGASWAWCRKQKASLKLEPVGFTAALFLFCLTDWICSDYSFLKGPGIRAEIILGALAAPAIAWMLARRSGALLFGVALFFFATFLVLSQGRLIFSDDNPAVLYRLYLLLHNFPVIPFYNPEWNAGMDARDFFATGILNVFLLFWPVLKIFGPLASYTAIVASILFGLMPLATYLGSRIEGLSRPVSAIAGILAMSSSLLWYRWALKYGSMGFICAACLVPLNLALASKIIDPDRPLSLRDVILALCSFTLMLFWSITGVIFLPLAVLALIRIRGLWTKPWIKTILVGILVLNLPWMAMFLSVSRVSTFVSLKTPTITAREKMDTAVDHAAELQQGNLSERSVKGNVRKFSAHQALIVSREALVKFHPLVFMLVVPGILLLSRKRSRWTYGSTACWLLFLGSVVNSMKPQLELDRMFVIFGLIAAVPTALAIGQLIDQPRAKIPAAFALGLLFAGVFSVSRILYNRSPEQMKFADPIVQELTDAIRQYGGEGRTVFSGFMLHQLSEGHIAPLAWLSGKPLVASSPFHNLWWYTDVVPASYRNRGDQGLNDYLDAMNASAVVAHESYWVKYFRERPEEYTERWSSGIFHIYSRVKYQPTYFVSGSGSIDLVDSNHLELTPSSPNVTIKFRYFPFLKSSTCELAEAPVDEALSLIQLRNCTPGTRVSIQSVNPLKRIFGGGSDA